MKTTHSVMAKYVGYCSDSTDSSTEPDQPMTGRLFGAEQYISSSTSLADDLRRAASRGQVDKIKELIASGACFDVDCDGRTALHYSAVNGFSEAVKILLMNGAGAVINVCDKLGYTALHQAAARGHTDVIHLLTTFGCCLDTQDNVNGNTPLHDAAWFGFSRTVQILTSRGANVQLLNKASFSALHLSAQNGHNQTARILLYAGCSHQQKNSYGDTALHTAARYGHAGITRILISVNCNINECNKNQDTALHIAAALKRLKISKLLVEAGINTAIRNKQGERALDVAIRKQHVEVIALLSKQAKISARGLSSSFDGVDSRMKSSEPSIDSEEANSSKNSKKKKKSFFFKKNKSKNKENKDKQLSDTESRSSAPSLSNESSSLPLSKPNPLDLVNAFRQHKLHQLQLPAGSIRMSSFDPRSDARHLPFHYTLKDQPSLVPVFKEPLPPELHRNRHVVVPPAVFRSYDTESAPLKQHVHYSHALPSGSGLQWTGRCQDVEYNLSQQQRSNIALPCNSKMNGKMSSGGRLYRSRSDESLYSASVLQYDKRAQAALTLKRQFGLQNNKPPHIRQDFVFDTDEVVAAGVDLEQCRVAEGRSTHGSTGPFVEDFTRGRDTEMPPLHQVATNVIDWFARNDFDAATMESFRQSRTCKQQSATVHDL